MYFITRRSLYMNTSNSTDFANVPTGRCNDCQILQASLGLLERKALRAISSFSGSLNVSFVEFLQI